MHVPPLLHAVSLIHVFADREAMVRQSRLLGGRSWHCPCFRTLIEPNCCTLFLLNGFSLASLCDAQGEKDPTAQDTCGASLAPTHIRLQLYAPSQLSDYYEDKTPASDKPF